MTNRERILAVFHGDPVDRIPFMHWDRHFPRGLVEREVRNLGMGLCTRRPCYVESHPNVEVTQKMLGRGTLVRTYHTPLGSLTEKWKVGVGYGEAWYGRDWKGILPRRIEYLIKKTEDYDIMEFIVEDARYEPYYEAIKDAQRHLGEEGIVITTIGYSPFQKMLIEWIGTKKFYIDFYKNREIIEKLYNSLAKKQEEIFHVAADSPAEYIGYGDNIDSVLVHPRLFERYYIPMYNRCARIVHARGKILGVHMDGRLKALAQTIAKSEIDVVEAFTPPPMGDLPLDDALSLWKRKVIWMNYPSSVYLSGPEPVKNYLLDLLEMAIPGERLMLAASTEIRVPEECLRVVAEVMREVTLPLSKQKIDNIRNKIRFRS